MRKLLFTLVAAITAISAVPAAGRQADSQPIQEGEWEGELTFSAGLSALDIATASGYFEGTMEVFVLTGALATGSATLNASATATVAGQSGSDTTTLSGPIEGTAGAPILNLSNGTSLPLHITYSGCDLASGWWGSDVFRENVGQSSEVEVNWARGRWIMNRTDLGDDEAAATLARNVRIRINEVLLDVILVTGTTGADLAEGRDAARNTAVGIWFSQAVTELEQLRNELANMSQCEKDRVAASGVSVEEFENEITDVIGDLIVVSLGSDTPRRASEWRTILSVGHRVGAIGAGAVDQGRAKEIEGKIATQMGYELSKRLLDIPDDLSDGYTPEEVAAFEASAREGAKLSIIARRLRAKFTVTGDNDDELSLEEAFVAFSEVQQ